MSLAYKNGTYGYNGEYEMSSVNKHKQKEDYLQRNRHWTI